MLLNSIGEINNLKFVLSKLRQLVQEFRDMSDDDIISAVNKSALKDNCTYYDEGYNKLDSSAIGGRWLWVDTGYKTKTDCIIYIQFGRTSDGIYRGGIVGTERSIIEFQLEQNCLNSLKPCSIGNSIISSALDKVKAEIEYSEEPDEIKLDDYEKDKEFYDVLLDRLLVKDSWSSNRQCIKEYINSVISRLNHLMHRYCDYSDYLVLNSTNTTAVFNSGLFDNFGKQILVRVGVLKEKEELRYTGLSIVESKTDLLNLGFSKSSISNQLVRVPFYNNSATELIFSANIDDFDFDNYERISHCIKERIDRFPEKYRDVSLDVLCKDLITQVKLGVSISKYDMSYIKPIYYRKFDSIHFAIPYHLFGDFKNKPDLAVLVANYDDTFWQIMTVLEYDDALRNTRMVSPFSEQSF